MSSDQVAAYRPAPVTQRDGSALASSNCRMASIATGLDFETGGAKRSTGAQMRSSQDDQSGGTDSGDARVAWDRGYDEVLVVRDGQGWPVVLEELVAGHLVHLDVWHASVGGPCLSGTGQYGHTMAVLPDCAGGSWLVADPWCSPPKWVRVAEGKLKAGAEEWGRRVYGAAALEADYPTGGAPDDPRVQLVVERVVRRFMSTSFPGHEVALPRGPETGGAPPVLFTVTHAAEVEMSSIPVTDPTPYLADVSEGVQLYNLDMTPELRMPQTRTGIRVPFSSRSAGGTTTRAIVYTRPDPDPDVLLCVYNVDARNLRPQTSSGGDGVDADEVRRERDAEWVDALSESWPVTVEPVP